jgi:hypothetical protein
MSMDLRDVLAELKKERDAIGAAIVSLERLDRPGNDRPGNRSGNPGPGRRLNLAAKSIANHANSNCRQSSPAPREE